MKKSARPSYVAIVQRRRNVWSTNKRMRRALRIVLFAGLCPASKILLGLIRCLYFYRGAEHPPFLGGTPRGGAAPRVNYSWLHPLSVFCAFDCNSDAAHGPGAARLILSITMCIRQDSSASLVPEPLGSFHTEPSKISMFEKSPETTWEQPRNNVRMIIVILKMTVK